MTVALFALAGCVAPSVAPPPPSAPTPTLTLTPADYAALPGWDAGRQDLALTAFRNTCPRLARLADDTPVGPPYAGKAEPWKAACATAAGVPDDDPAAARAFFEARFAPVALTAADRSTGLVTAYYEPEIDARLTPAWPYLEPLLRPPANLEVVEAPNAAAYARTVREEVFVRTPSGALLLAPPRGAIRREARAPGGARDAIAYGRLSDVVFLQIQGSGRLRMPDGSELRAAYAANNGRPYASIARALADAGEMPIEQASNARIKAWLDAAAPADADRIVDANERYVYFAAESLGASPAGPRGAAGVPLTQAASIAVDPDWHAAGTLIWIAPEGAGAPAPRLGVPQDAGGAITGPLRADLYFGTGEAAGQAAARVRHQARWWALAPRDLGAGAGAGP